MAANSNAVNTSNCSENCNKDGVELLSKIALQRWDSYTEYIVNYKQILSQSIKLRNFSTITILIIYNQKQTHSQASMLWSS
jgi:hypothetical protein